MSDLVERLRAYASDDHERGCQGRYYDCSCGYDGKRDPLLEEAADRIAQLEAALREIDHARYTGRNTINLDNAYEMAIARGRPPGSSRSWLLTILLMGGHFAVPFFYLMGRAVKRRGSTLAVVAAWLLVMHFMDLYWQVMPTLHPEGVRPSVLDVAAFVAIGGCFVSAAGWLMRRQALVPLRDPRLPESLAFENV